MELLIDSHAHLTDEAFTADLPDVIQRAVFSGIDRVVVAAENLGDAERAETLARRFDMLVAMAGVHPHRAGEWSSETRDRLRSLIERGAVVAVGEIGLDFHRAEAGRDAQVRAFRDQIRLAKQTHLPIVVHCRDAYEDLIEILQAESPFPCGGVIHCFTGTAETARRLLDLGFYIGVTGLITFRKSGELRATVAETIGLDRLLVETDSPCLAPHPHRGKRNEPGYAWLVARSVAAAKGIELADVAAQTRRNAMRLFRLGCDLAAQSVAYQLGNSLYLNLTNRCTNNCVFCARTTRCALGPYDLRLAREPTPAELIRAIGDNPDSYDEIVFCGYGEPTIRLETLLLVGRWLKARGVRRVRLNTNGHGNAIHGRSIVGELSQVVDAVSVSLNAATPEEYDRLCRPTDPRFGHDEVCRFIEQARSAIGEVVASAVDYPGADIEACRRLARQRLGVRFRLRPFRPAG